jgi:hypothetical protein
MKSTVASIAHPKTFVRISAMTLAASSIAVSVSLAGGGTLSESDGEIAGVPAVVFLFALVEEIWSRRLCSHGSSTTHHSEP